MANPQPEKAPKLNALLIGKRTVPSGCRVLNVSQQGMSLQCEPDGRLLTFKSGDAVDIFLSVQHTNGHNKFTIPAIVSHADESLIDVVFHCTDTELAGLIESYRTSESHNLGATIDHRLISKAAHQTRPVAVNKGSSVLVETDGTTGRGDWSFYVGLLALFMTSLVLLGSYYYVSSLNKRITSLENIGRTHTKELAEVQSQVFKSRLQDGRYASLNARMMTLTDAFQSFEERISKALLQKNPAKDTTPKNTVSKTVTTESGGQRPDVITSKPPAPEVRYITRVELDRKPTSKTAPAPTPKYTNVIKKPSTTSLANTSKQSPQKYPEIKFKPLASPAATSTTPSTATKPVKTRMNQATIDGKPATTSTSSKTEEATAATSAASDKSPTNSTSASTVDKQQAQPKRVPVTTASIPTSPETLDGPWVINLLSSPSKTYVEEMLAAAKSSGFDAVITGAEVRGKQYWRLQLPGFDSHSAARKAAEPVKDGLKIKDVWIFKRKR